MATAEFSKFAGIFHAKMSTIKDRNGSEVTEAKDIKHRWQEFTEGLYKTDLHDLDNHNGVITYLEPHILKCEVKWALGSITMNKDCGGNGISVELFQITHVYLWQIHFDIWQNQYNIVKLKNKIKKKPKKKKKEQERLYIKKKKNKRSCESVACNIPANLENSAVATGLEMVSFHSNP